ncbi:hypothetical protein ACFPOI_18095 [Nonomuraea angiospora]|uniref:DUF1648 domain-containing protein n=1 Tax=Nonomuraea angiospora TaxID=46172 RepID=A0ABR9MI06_9ACTN|nr:DUF1648 domain-containing protein [Nonomuraea angiospora]MBE1592562.1 hypothetical protein [Nonomuraea angiospora]
MNPRITAVIWGLFVICAQIALPLALRDRLPDPLATRWELGGLASRSMSLTTYIVVMFLVWAVLWLVALAAAERATARRQSRTVWWGGLFGLGALALGVNVTTVLANLDAPDWAAARLPGWQVLAVIAAGTGLAVLAGYLRRGAPDADFARRIPPLLRLGAGRRTVWVGHVANRWLALLPFAALAAALVLGLLYVTGLVSGVTATSVLPGLVLVLAAGVLTSSVSVQVGDGRMAVQFGPLGWPARRIPLSQIESAWSETRHPAEVGGWGIRGLPGSSTIMLRGGECLVIRYRSGGRLAISIDDAERGASLINALIAERVEQ